MMRYVAFLRAINVGGHVVKMDHLRQLFEAMGFTNVKTFIASGNVLFDACGKNAAALETKIGNALRQSLGYDVAVFIRTTDELAEVCKECDGAPLEGSVFVGFLPTMLDAREKELVAALASPVDELRVHKREVYWQARKNFSDAMFQPAKMEKALGKPATFRNSTTVRKITALLLKPCLILALAGGNVAAQDHIDVPADPVPVIQYRATLVQHWLAAVLDHQPGTDDAALAFVRSWNADQLRESWLTANLVVALLEEPTRRRFILRHRGAEARVVLRAGDLQLLALNAEELLIRPGRNAFLKRAALLHMDAVLLAGAQWARGPFNVSFLLPNRTFVLTGDGRQDSLHGGNVNWEFARVLLDGVAGKESDGDVRLWYRATLEYLLSTEQYDNPHFEHALRSFPRDPNMLHLVGCLHEALSAPSVQTVRGEIRTPPKTILDVRSERAELSVAETRFRQALEGDPQHHEARLRLGRTLARRGQHQDAATELNKAYTEISDPLLTYYAALFLGAEEEALGRATGARELYARAAVLYPQAQAPQLALSQLAHASGDRTGARAVLEGVLITADEKVDDPWWSYFTSCGRTAETAVHAFYSSVYGVP